MSEADLFTMTYPHTPGCKVAGTSQEAAKAEQGRAKTLRDKVLQLLTYATLTADECSDLMRESPLAIRPRLSELRAMGKIEPCGRRKNQSGHSAWVWRAK